MEKEDQSQFPNDELKIKKEWDKIVYWMVFIVFILLIVAFISSLPKAYNKSQLNNNTVVKIIDGDTFEYYDETTDKMLKVRLLCVDAPEKKEQGYEESKAFLRELILYKEVSFNSSLKDKDAYGRLLRFVYVNDWGDNLFVNKAIVDNGYGSIYIIPPEDCSELM